MTRLCLDTSAYSHFRRGDLAAVDAIASAREVGVPVIVLGELRAGFAQGSRPDDNERELREFLVRDVVRTLEVDDDASAIYAELFWALRRAGSPIPTNDLWIAAVAVREGATLLTYDGHFRRVARLAAKIL